MPDEDFVRFKLRSNECEELDESEAFSATPPTAILLLLTVAAAPAMPPPPPTNEFLAEFVNKSRPLDDFVCCDINDKFDRALQFADIVVAFNEL